MKKQTRRNSAESHFRMDKGTQNMTPGTRGRQRVHKEGGGDVSAGILKERTGTTYKKGLAKSS